MTAQHVRITAPQTLEEGTLVPGLGVGIPEEVGNRQLSPSVMVS